MKLWMEKICTCETSKKQSVKQNKNNFKKVN